MAGLFSVTDLHFEYPNTPGPTFSGVSFSVPANSITALVGPSGSGKSTLLRLLAGLWPPTTGEMYLEEEAVSPYALELIPGHPDIILVHQDYQIPGHQPLIDSLRWPLRYEEEAKREAEINHLIALLGLDGLAHRKPNELSGGQQQRAALALGLLESPTVLLLDEPFSHVDAPRRRALRADLRRRVAEENLTVIFTTHEPEDALSLADTVGLLDGGQLLQWGKPEEVYHRPPSRQAARLLGPFSVITNPNKQDERLFLRPSAVRISTSGQYHGTVGQSEFHGPYHLTYIHLSATEYLIAAHHQPVAKGTKVQFDIAEDACFVLPSENTHW